MRNEIIGMMVGMVLISFASAGLVDYLSNTITGSVEVRGPVFYLNSILDFDNDYTLKLNDDDVSPEEIEMIGRVTQQINFKSDALGIDMFYDEKFVVNLDMEAVNENSSRSSKIGIRILAVDAHGDESTICDNELLNMKNRDIYSIDCVPSGYSLNDLDLTDRLMLEIDRMTTSSNYTFYLGDSNIEVMLR